MWPGGSTPVPLLFRREATAAFCWSIARPRALGLCHERHVQNSGGCVISLILGAKSLGHAAVPPASPCVPAFLGVGRPCLAAPCRWRAMPGSPHEPQASLGECLLRLVNYKLFIYFGNQVTRGCRWALSPGPGRPSVGPGRERVQCFWWG